MYRKCRESKSVQGSARVEIDLSTTGKKSLNMEQKELGELVAKYNAGLAEPHELLEIEKLIENGELEITQLKSLELLAQRIDTLTDATPTIEQDNRFYEMLGTAVAGAKSQQGLTDTWNWKLFLPRFAFAFSLLLVGAFGGYFLSQPQTNSEVKQLTQQVAGLKEMMMISLLEKESATERLKAVGLTQEIADPSAKVTQALLKTLTTDENVNVRLAALEALQAYAKEPHVREGLIRSIAQQDSPLVQVALAELMLALQEKSSVSELQKVLELKKTPKEVKEKIKKTIDVLI
jgi:hypothetical protein